MYGKNAKISLHKSQDNEFQRFHRGAKLCFSLSRECELDSTVYFSQPARSQSMLQIAYTYAVHIGLHTNLYSAKNRENESEALAQDD